MADLTYTATLDDKISPALKKIEGNVNKVSATFDKLKGALAGLALGTVIQNAYRFADGVQDITDATGIATNAVIGFSQAVQLNGGSVDGAQNSLVKFVQTIGEAAEGSAKAQNAFAEVGVTLQDLATLSEQQLFEKTIKGLGQITDKSKQAVLAAELLGKGFKGVNISGVAGQYQALSQQSQTAAASTKAAADAIQQGEIAMAQFQQSILAVLKPINEFIAGLDPKKIQETVNAVTRLGASILVLYGYVKVAGVMLAKMEALVVTLTGAAATAGAAMLAFGARMVAGFTVFGKIILIASAVNQAIKIAFNVDIIGSFIKYVSGAYDAVKKFLGIKDDMADGGAGAGRGGNDAITKQLQERGEELRKEAEEVRKVQDAYEKQKKQIEQSSDAFRKQNQEFVQGIQLETSLVGKSEEYAEVVRTVAELNKKAAAETEKLRQQKQLLTGEDAKLAPLYDAQIAKIEQVRKADEARIVTAVQGLQSAKLLEQDRINTLQRITDQLEKQKQLDESILQIRQSTQAQLDTAGFEKAQMGRTPLEQQFASIQENARKAALEAGRAFSEQFTAEDMGAEDAKKLADGLALIAERYKAIADAQSANLAMSRTWEQGWADAFNQYMDNATNAATRAGEVFGSITSRMNSAIDNFVETGKFSFKDFTRSIIQDLIKIELKAQATKLLGAIGGGGGIFSAIGSLLGFAEGGQPPVNKPSIVGEKGPELFVPKQAGTVIPNNKLGMGGGQTINNTYITNQISAIDSKSVAQLFAENRKTLLGTVQLAQKELPYGNR